MDEIVALLEDCRTKRFTCTIRSSLLSSHLSACLLIYSIVMHGGNTRSVSEILNMQITRPD